MLEDDVAVAKRVARASIAIPSAVAIAKSATGAAIAVVSDVTISCYCHGPSMVVELRSPYPVLFIANCGVGAAMQLPCLLLLLVYQGRHWTR